MKKLLFLLFVLFAWQTMSAQDKDFHSPTNVRTKGWTFEYSLGYGAYQLDDMKGLQDAMLGLYGLKETDRFPGNITHTFALGYMTGYHHFGANLSYLTTGGRLHRADYSGSYKVDMIMTGYRLGTLYRYYINTGFSPLRLYLQMSPGVMFSNLKMEEKVNIHDESQEDSNTLKATGIYVEPTIGASFRITDWLHFSLSGGYQADFSGTLKYSGQKTQTKAHWDGLRLYASLTFILSNILSNKNISTP